MCRDRRIPKKYIDNALYEVKDFIDKEIDVVIENIDADEDGYVSMKEMNSIFKQVVKDVKVLFKVI